LAEAKAARNATENVVKCMMGLVMDVQDGEEVSGPQEFVLYVWVEAVYA
jgi:hypothetical protein